MDEDEKPPQRVSRKLFVQISGVGIASAGLAGCTPASNGTTGANGAATGAPSE